MSGTGRLSPLWHVTAATGVDGPAQLDAFAPRTWPTTMRARIVSTNLEFLTGRPWGHLPSARRIGTSRERHGVV
jgi:hypothetical protein